MYEEAKKVELELDRDGDEPDEEVEELDEECDLCEECKECAWYDECAGIEEDEEDEPEDEYEPDFDDDDDDFHARHLSNWEDFGYRPFGCQDLL